jgi:hypothetical protein
MIPTTARFGANTSERRLFTALEGIPNQPDWVVFHSLTIRQHLDKHMGEADFVVVAPGRGILVIEAKAPSGVHYRDGVWTLDGTPDPHKDPLAQLDGAVRSIRSYLKREGAIDGTEPFVRLLWFTSIGRHHFTGRAPEDLSFFEWELAWADDLADPAKAVEKTLDAHLAWHRAHGNAGRPPAALTESGAAQIVAALTRDFSFSADDRDSRREFDWRESAVLAEQRFALELVEANRAVYFDGPAGSGKSWLVAQAALDAIKRSEKTLLTCWNVVMADRLRTSTAAFRGPLAVADLGQVMLRAAGLDRHPDATLDDWYQHELPSLALAGLAAHPERGGYRNVIVDEFQDIAGNPLLVDVLEALATPGARFMFAGDARQQIMRRAAEQVDPFAIAKERMPDLVLARIRRNCRQSPALVSQSEAIIGRHFGFTDHRLGESTPGGAELLRVSPGNAVPMLAGVLKLLIEKHGLGEVVVLSPWGPRSLASRIASGDLSDAAHAADLRWLRGVLGTGREQVQFGSISKLKGIETAAVVVTDVGEDGRAWAAKHDLDWDDLLYVALSRAKFRAVVLEPRGEVGQIAYGETDN